MMSAYDVQQVCRNGHQITDQWVTHPGSRQAFCEKCGAATINACPSCNKWIRGGPRDSPVIVIPPRAASVPSHCIHCGSPYPWTATASGLSSTAWDQTPAGPGFWHLLHPRILAVARDRFAAGNYADAVEASFKELNNRVKAAYTATGKPARDGVDLMRSAFGGASPTLVLADPTTETGRNIQEGYGHIFAGAIQGIRNPKAHENLIIDPHRASLHLLLASLLMGKLDDAGTA